MINKFITFVNTYSKVDKIDDKIITIINTGLKKYNNFDPTLENEALLYINESDFEDFCLNKIDNTGMIPIKLDDPRLTEYIKIYKDMKKLYIENCEYLLDLLETKILVKLPNSEKDETPIFTIQNIGYSDLIATEKTIRDKLVSMYSGCHQEYQKGMVALYNALKQPVA